MVLNSPKGFGDLFLRSHSFLDPNHLKTLLPNYRCPFLLHSQAWMPCKQQWDNPTIYQIHFFAKLHKQIKHWLQLKFYSTAIEMKKKWTALTALSKFLVLLAIFLLANSGDAFMNLSSAAGNLVLANHWIRFVEPMSKPTSKPAGKPTQPTELPNILTSKQGKYSLLEKQDAELPSKITVLIAQLQSMGWVTFMLNI